MFSKTFAYALRAMTYIAQHSSEEKKVSLDELANSIQSSPHYLGKIMQDLVRKGFLNSAKGPGGGFWLNGTNKDISIFQLLNAIDGDQTVNACLMGKLKCEAKNPCPMHDEYSKCRTKLFDLMKSTLLKNWEKERRI